MFDPLDPTRDGLPLFQEEAVHNPNHRFLGAHTPLGCIVEVEPVLYGARCLVRSQDGEERMTPLARLQSLGLALDAEVVK
jgi:hypothetical protein